MKILRLLFICFYLTSPASAVITGTLFNISTFGNGNAFPQLAVNPNGQALVAWTRTFTNQIAAAFYNGTSWAPQIILGAGNAPDVGIDQFGNGITIWVAPNNQIVYSRFNVTSQTWSAPIALTNTGFNSSPKIAMNIFGNAGALWFRAPQQIVVGSTFNASTGAWSTPAQVFVTRNTSPVNFDALSLNGVQMMADAKGNVIAIWQNLTTNTIQAFIFPIP